MWKFVEDWLWKLFFSCLYIKYDFFKWRLIIGLLLDSKEGVGDFFFLKDLLVFKNVISKIFYLVYENKVLMYLVLY